MKLVLTVSNLITREEKFANRMDQFDPTFSTRYLFKENDFTMLKGEDHWDADKYKILYFDCDKKNLPDLLEALKENEDCAILAKVNVDKDYHVNKEPLYANEHMLALSKSGRFRDIYAIHKNIRQREKGFIPQHRPS
jgi:hypothetical protein